MESHVGAPLSSRPGITCIRLGHPLRSEFWYLSGIGADTLTGIETGERLVHQENRGPPDHGAAHGHALTLTAGELPWGSCQQMVDAQNAGH